MGEARGITPIYQPQVLIPPDRRTKEVTNLMKTKTPNKKISGIELARLGGKASFKKLGKKGMSAIGKKGAEARWGKKLKAKSK